MRLKNSRRDDFFRSMIDPHALCKVEQDSQLRTEALRDEVPKGTRRQHSRGLMQDFGVGFRGCGAEMKATTGFGFGCQPSDKEGPLDK